MVTVTTTPPPPTPQPEVITIDDDDDDESPESFMPQLPLPPKIPPPIPAPHTPTVAESDVKPLIDDSGVVILSPSEPIIHNAQSLDEWYNYDGKYNADMLDLWYPSEQTNKSVDEAIDLFLPVIENDETGEAVGEGGNPLDLLLKAFEITEKEEEIRREEEKRRQEEEIKRKRKLDEDVERIKRRKQEDIARTRRLQKAALKKREFDAKQKKKEEFENKRYERDINFIFNMLCNKINEHQNKKRVSLRQKPTSIIKQLVQNIENLEKKRLEDLLTDTYLSDSELVAACQNVEEEYSKKMDK